jgi:hypothetical protein
VAKPYSQVAINCSRAWRAQRYPAGQRAMAITFSLRR